MQAMDYTTTMPEGAEVIELHAQPNGAYARQAELAEAEPVPAEATAPAPHPCLRVGGLVLPVVVGGVVYYVTKKWWAGLIAFLFTPCVTWSKE